MRGMACASQLTDPLSLSATEVDARLATRRIGLLRYFNGDTHRAGFALPNYVRDLTAKSGVEWQT